VERNSAVIEAAPHGLKDEGADHGGLRGRTAIRALAGRSAGGRLGNSSTAAGDAHPAYPGIALRAIVADGCPPILLVGADVAGREREYQFAWLIGEVYARVLGEPCVVHEIERAMRTLLQAG
jgi:hypothetical protein